MCAAQSGGPKIISIQNCYNLLVRTAFETDLAETCSPKNANVGLLAYSPLAGGVLTGGCVEVSLSSTTRRASFCLYPYFCCNHSACCNCHQWCIQASISTEPAQRAPEWNFSRGTWHATEQRDPQLLWRSTARLPRNMEVSMRQLRAAYACTGSPSALPTVSAAMLFAKCLQCSSFWSHAVHCWLQ